MRLYPYACYPVTMNEMARDTGHQPIGVDQPGIYRIKIQGRLSQTLANRFDEMAISVETIAIKANMTNMVDIPITTLTGQIADQSALHGLVARIRDLGLPLILVELVRPVDHGE